MPERSNNDAGRVVPSEGDRSARLDVDVLIRDVELRSIPEELLGTNVPAWLGPAKLADAALLQAIADLGVKLIRMPGGSWSNSYDWLGCELSDESTCYFVGSARPSDFAALLEATGVAGIWTLSANATAESAAALVAFFNGSTSDDREIGLDRNGTDWKTVADWASLREVGGHAEPLGIQLWEFGNEVYGGRPAAGGSGCPSFGWEEVWTCLGAEYVAGDDENDGYLAVRTAMLRVDPSIEVGAVGVAPPGEWGGWGDAVIAAAGDDLDFFVVHSYGFDGSPVEELAVTRPMSQWRSMVESLDGVLASDIPIAVTEYNLVSFGDGDTEQSMIRAVNALYLADSIGQMAVAGVEIAAHWNLANGVMASGTDYGVIEADGFAPRPTYHALRAWGSLGSTLLSSAGEPTDVRVYPTRTDDGALRILAVHSGSSERRLSLGFDASLDVQSGTSSSTWTDDLSATVMETTEPRPLEEASGGLTATLPPYSISIIEVSLG